ncbi:MAG: hypothetical protein AABX37_02275 [Nanoarchaeota archaeon]
MAETFWGKVLEFIVGWIVLPKLLPIIITLLFAFLGVNLTESDVITKILEGMINVVLFFVRRLMAWGLLLETLYKVGVFGIILEKIKDWL